MPEFQNQINEARRLAETLGFSRLTFGWKEWDRKKSPVFLGGSVSVTSATPQVVRTYDNGYAEPWLSRFGRDLRKGVFGVSNLEQ